VRQRNQSCLVGLALTLLTQRLDVQVFQVWMHDSTYIPREFVGLSMWCDGASVASVPVRVIGSGCGGFGLWYRMFGARHLRQGSGDPRPAGGCWSEPGAYAAI
jgi:hypothetical protein